MMNVEQEGNIADSRLAGIAKELADEHAACEAGLRASVQHAVRAGQLLIEAKKLCPHGEWRHWLAKNFPGSERLAQSYMRAARLLPTLKGGNPQRVADLSLRDALQVLADPRPEPDPDPDPVRPMLIPIEEISLPALVAGYTYFASK